jgi:hypothetical protein
MTQPVTGFTSECHFCYDPAAFTVTFSAGRMIDVCSSICCMGRLPEVAKEEKDTTIHSIEVVE